VPIIKQKRITSEDCQANPDAIYLFGDNDERVGYGGQAAVMRDEENAIGIRTKWKPTMHPSAFFDDEDYDGITSMIHQDLEPARAHLAAGKVVVIPLDGLGTGLSKLPELAPRVFEYLTEQLTELEAI
jgi:hypothetical protein